MAYSEAQGKTCRWRTAAILKIFKPNPRIGMSVPHLAFARSLIICRPTFAINCDFLQNSRWRPAAILKTVFLSILQTDWHFFNQILLAARYRNSLTDIFHKYLLSEMTSCQVQDSSAAISDIFNKFGMGSWGQLLAYILKILLSSAISHFQHK